MLALLCPVLAGAAHSDGKDPGSLGPRLTFALRMTLTSSPIQITKMNFSLNECSSLLYLILTYAKDARWGCSAAASSDRSPEPVDVSVRAFDLSDCKGGERQRWGLSQRARGQQTIWIGVPRSRAIAKSSRRPCSGPSRTLPAVS